MGNNQSQYQQQFNDRYSFIALIQDVHFGSIKVYRKIHYNYDYMMIIQGELKNLSEEQILKLEDHLHLIRHHQAHHIIKLFHFRVMRQDKIQCQVALLRIYAEYFNKTLYDYLLQLRNKRILLSIDQALYIIKSVKYGRSYPEMQIHEIELHSCNIFISVIGQVYLSPIEQIKRWLHMDWHYKPITKIHRQYKPQIPKPKYQTSFPQKQLIKGLFLQLTQYMSSLQFPSSRPIYDLIESSRNLQDLLRKIPNTQVQALLIDQVIKSDEAEKQGENFNNQ